MKSINAILLTVILTVLLTVFVSVTGSAQSFAAQEAPKPTSAPLPDKTEEAKVKERMNQLEAQLKLMQEQIDALKKQLDDREPASPVQVAAAKTSEDDPVQNPAIASRDPVPAESKKKTDLGFDAGDYRITPYGIIFFNAFANSGGTNNADDPLWAVPGASGNASASGRQTRLGVRFEGGKLGGANIKGVVEADFYGGFPAVGVGESMGVVRLRLANVRLDWERTSLLVGQDWMLFAPNSPTSLAAQAIPQFAAAGNPWARLPQVRVEQQLGKNFRWQGAILAPQTGDFPVSGNPLLLQPGAGAVSRVPFFQSRLSYANGNWFGAKSAGTIGIAGHLGRSRISNSSVTEDINSYGIALDWKFPIVKRVTAAGEAFVGENIGGFQAGIFQGYNSDFGPPVNSLGAARPGIRGIRTSGGWLQIGWNVPAFEDRLSLYGSFGIEDPNNGDLLSISNRNFRSRNRGYAFDAIYDFSKQFGLGFEFRRLETDYFLGNRDSSNHFNLGAKYSF